MPRADKWSLKFDQCIKCGRNDLKHVARGFCLSCYRRETEKRNRGEQRVEQRRELRERYGLPGNRLTRKHILNEYSNKKRSLIDIARDCNCSRQYVYKKMVEFSIPLRTKQGARELAYDQAKIKFRRLDINGRERSITANKIRVNEKFFSTWSKEMAYVLGVVYTDGHVDPGSKIDPTRRTQACPRLMIFQKDPEILNKVLKLMNCDAKLYHHNRQDLY
jgi:hypothetical protein